VEVTDIARSSARKHTTIIGDLTRNGRIERPFARSIISQERIILPWMHRLWQKSNWFHRIHCTFDSTQTIKKQRPALLVMYLFSVKWYDYNNAKLSITKNDSSKL